MLQLANMTDLQQRGKFWLLCMFLVLVFLTGGSARADVQSLAILRPASVLVFGISLWTLKKQNTSDNLLWMMLLSIFGLVAVYLIPLPASLWQKLPNRDLITSVDILAQLNLHYQEMALNPNAAWNAFYALFTPAATVLLMLQLNRQQKFKILPIIISLGLASGILGVLQAIGNPEGSLYFYRITNNGSTVGVFANRNHQAILLALLFPMLAAYAASVESERRKRSRRSWLAIGASIVLIPLILVTGSRAGLIAGTVGIFCAVWIYWGREALDKKGNEGAGKVKKAVIFAGVALLTLATFLTSRAEAIRRLLDSDSALQTRDVYWQPVLEMATQYLPFGSGPGSFVATYNIIESQELITQNFLNHAHNDFLEYYAAFGLLAVVPIIILILSIRKPLISTWKARSNKNKDTIFGILGLACLVIIALGSLGDYPLRTPFIATIAMVAFIWSMSVLPGNTKNRPVERKTVEPPRLVV